MIIPGGVETIGLDRPVLGFTLLLSLATGIIFGLAPAWQLSQVNLIELLKEGTRGTAENSRGHRIRSMLVIAELALTLVLLIGAGLW